MEDFRKELGYLAVPTLPGSSVLPVVLAELGYFLRISDLRFQFCGVVNAATISVAARLPGTLPLFSDICSRDFWVLQYYAKRSFGPFLLLYTIFTIVVLS